MRSFLANVLRFVAEVFRQFSATNGLQAASALAYTTLISLVPLMMLSIGLLSAFPSFQAYSKTISTFIFQHFVPSSAHVIQSYIELYASNASRLSAAGLFFSLIGAVTLLFTMESAFNTIWRVRKARRGFSAFLLYWAMLTLMPLALVATFALSIFLLKLPSISSLVQAVTGILPVLYLIPILGSFLVFVFLYKALPNHKVPLKDAALGALASAVIFEALKVAFGFYISRFSTYSDIYGALAFVPIFLLWLYLLWLVVLFGAVVAYVAGNYWKTK
ncbi:MAG TPA: YihY family inner membrane protein [Myxococcota bacterium]|nr:YihY family inner membrane protein [Myxococcota bacterium]